jgi:hypothetical protein
MSTCPPCEQGDDGQKYTLTLAGDGTLDVADDAIYYLRETIVVQRSRLPTKSFGQRDESITSD